MTVEVVAAPRMMILRIMMCTSLAALQYVPLGQILHHNLMTALNVNRNARSIGVRLYIVTGSGCWMWTPCGCPVHILSEGEYRIQSSN